MSEQWNLTPKGEALLDRLAGTEQGGTGKASTPSRPSHQMFTNALRCPGCGSEGFVRDMAMDAHGWGWRWTFHCTGEKCGDRTYRITEFTP